jgi:TP901 family phage tail tape measure protein
LRADVLGFEAQMRGAAGTVTSSTSKMEGVIRGVSAVGKAALLGLGAAAVGVGVASVKLAMDFEGSMTRIQSMEGLTAAHTKTLNDAILQMAGHVAQAPKDLADAMLLIYQAGFKGATAVDMLTRSAELASSSGQSLTDVVNGVTSTVKAWGSRSVDAKTATDILASAFGHGGVMAGDFSKIIGRVGPLAAKTGLQLTDVAAAVATLAQEGLTGMKATGGLATMLGSILTPSSAAAADLKKVGLSVQDLQDSIASKGLGATLQMLIDKFKGNTAALKDVVGGTTGLRFALDLTGAHAADYAANLTTVQDATKGGGASADAFAEAQKHLEVQLRQLVAGAEALGVKLGEWLIPIIQKIIGWFQEHVGVAKVLAEVIGGVLVLAIGTFLAGLVTLGSGIAIVVAAVAGLAAWWLSNKEHMQAFTDAIKAVVDWLVANFGPPIMTILHAIENAWQMWGDNIIAFVSSALDFVVRVIGDQLRIVGDVIKIVLDVITGHWGDAWNAVKDLVGAVWDEIKALVDVALGALKGIVTGGLHLIEVGVGIVWDAIKGAASVAWELIKDAVMVPVQLAHDAIVTVFHAVRAALGIVWDAIKGAAETGWNAIVTVIRGALNLAIEAINILISGLNRVHDAMAFANPFGGAGWGRIDPIPTLGAGAIIQGRTLALLGEVPGQKEAVVPLTPAGMAAAGLGPQKGPVDLSEASIAAIAAAVRPQVVPVVWRDRFGQELDQALLKIAIDRKAV